MNSYVALVHLCQEQYPIEAVDCHHLRLTPAFCLARLITETLQHTVYSSFNFMIDDLTMKYVGLYDNSADYPSYVAKIGALSVAEHRPKIKTVLQRLKTLESNYKANLNLISPRTAR